MSKQEVILCKELENDLTHAISYHFLIPDEVSHQGDVGVVTYDNIRIFQRLYGFGSHFLLVTRSNADDPDNPRAMATVALANFVFGRSVFPFIDSINAAD